MEYTLVDTYGSTLDVFQGLSKAREAISALLREDPESADELIVLPYEAGRRVGSPIAARDFVAPRKSYFAQVMAAYASDWTPEISVAFPPTDRLETAIEIEWEAEEADPDPELLDHGQRLATC